MTHRPPARPIYSARVTLYHMLTRHYPYGEIEPFQHRRFGEPVPPTRYSPDAPFWLENVLLKAAARDTADRFETAEEFLLALERGATRPLAPPPAKPWRSKIHSGLGAPSRSYRSSLISYCSI